MIINFREHAANERTFLDRVRTAIAVIAFGFFVERFDFLLRFLSRTSGHSLYTMKRGFALSYLIDAISG